MNNEQRLQLISEMINISRNNFQKSSFYFLLWGIVIAIGNLAHFALLEFSSYEHPYVVWLITIPAIIVTIIYSIRQDKSALVRNHLDKVIASIWIVYALCISVFVVFGYKINFQINPIILALTAIPTFTTGMILKFKPLLFGAAVFIGFSVLAFTTDYYPYQFLIGALAISIGYLIPGILLKAKENKNGV